MAGVGPSYRKHRALLIATSTTLVASLYLLSIVNQSPSVDAVVVDGKRKGPSALKNQSHEDELIDGYNTKTCGVSDPDTQKSDYVNSAKEGQFPWLVSFQIKKEANKTAHFCMGSFISDKWILSAAHCFADPKLKPFLEQDRVILSGGSKNAYSKENAKFKIKRIFYHSKFDRSSPIGFDVALIEIAEKANIKEKYDGQLPYINTVCLPITGKEFTEGQAVKLAGWGDTESKDPKSKPDNLLTTDLIISNTKKCANIFAQKLKKVKSQYKNIGDFICADYHGQRDACQGDSGGSLLEYADGKAVAVGIVSYGLGCATKGVPGVYTKTSSMMPWIKDITRHKEKATVQYKVLKAGSEEAKD